MMGQFENNETRNVPDTLQSDSLPMEINGHEAIDLGLSVKWATCNVGAFAPEEYGDYFAWGETESKEEYTAANSLTYGQEDVKHIAGDVRYDAARCHWRATWRLPNKKEWEELRDKCTWLWSSREGIFGYNIIGPNGNAIFLPTTGKRLGTSIHYVETCGCYWSSLAPESNTLNAYTLGFYDSSYNLDWEDRSFGRCVRPVSD